MKAHCLFLYLSWSLGTLALAQQPPAAAPAAAPAAMPQRSAAELEKLVAPIALYPDPLIATMLPASVYPLEIVQAARFVQDTNNLPKLDAQPWDSNVKAVARVPEVIQKMNTELSWTTELGEAFLAQDKELFDAIQKLRGQAAQIGNLKTSPQQIVTVTNTVVEKTIEQQVVVVTNTVVQVQPADPQVVYVPQYSPTVVYTTPPPADPTASLLSFGVGMLVGAAIADNNCDWHGGGCYSGNVNVNVNRNVNVNNNVNANRNVNNNRNVAGNGAGNKWQPDQNRLGKSGSPAAAASARTGDARGWGGGAGGQSAGRSPQASAAGQSAGRSPQATAGGPSAARSPQASAGGAAADRSPQAAAGGRSPQATAGGPAASANARSDAGGASPGASAGANRSSPSASPSRASSSGSAFGGAGGGGSDARSANSRGASSRSGGGGGGGGGGRSGGGGGGRR